MDLDSGAKATSERPSGCGAVPRVETVIDDAAVISGGINRGGVEVKITVAYLIENVI